MSWDDYRAVHILLLRCGLQVVYRTDGIASWYVKDKLEDV